MRRYLFGMRCRATSGVRTRGTIVVGLLGVLALVLSVGTASGAPSPGTAFATGSTYKVSPTAPSGWEQPGFSDSGWSSLSAPFANNEGTICPGTFPEAANDFPINGTLYLRKSFPLPSNAFGLHLLGSVDNDADVWVNGNAEGGHIDSGSCHTDAIDLQIPNSHLTHGGNNLVAVKAVDEGVASFFDMQATYGVIAFGQQPSETQQGSPISPAPTVTITDADGNAASGKNVTIALQTINGTGSLSGTTTVATDGSGIATFSNLKVSAAGTYKLVATSEGATTTSGAFVIANQVTPCSGKCDANGSAGGTSTSSSTNTSSGSLAVSVFLGTTPPDGVCTGLVPLGAGSFVNIIGSGSPFPDLTVTWRLDKDLVKQAGNPGASKFDICLGAEDLSHPDGVGTTPWTTKDGTPAVGVVDPNFPGIKLFWGVLKDCTKKGNTDPCVLHRNRNSGDEVIDFFKPSPWDGRVYGG